MASTDLLELFAKYRISTDDSPKREFDLYDSEGLPVETVEHDENTSSQALSESAIEAVSNRSNQRKTSRKPRREVWWLDLGTNNHSLTSVGQCFEDRLNWSLLSSSNPLLRHIRSPKDDNLRRSLHKCPGYLREEIALTCDLSKSIIVSHTFPDLSERCSICHQLVQYLPTPNSLPLPPTGGPLMFNHVDSSFGHPPDSDRMDTANQQTQQQHHTTNVLASSDFNNNQVNPPMSIGCTIIFSNDLINQIGSLNEQPKPDQTMQDLSSIKSGN